MSTTFRVVAARRRPVPGFTELWYLDLDELGVSDSPVSVLDDFRVQGLPFAPHPHAGFGAVTYVFEDSDTGLRSRASCGVDVTVGPGGIIWTHAGSGALHEEGPAEEGHELHGVQIFVNLSAANKLSEPRVLHLDAARVPEWRNDAGDRVRVVVGHFEGLGSPLVPVEPFSLLDIELRGIVSFPLPTRHNAIVYVRTGSVAVRADGQEHIVAGGHAAALRSDDATVTLAAQEASQLLVLAAAAIDEPVVSDGPFIMNDRAQIAEAISRYRTGAMGSLDRLPTNG